MKPLAIDLYAGRLGWSRGLVRAGFQVIAIDIVRPPDECICDGIHFLQADVLAFDAIPLAGMVRLVVASPMCDEFSRWSMPWTRAKNPPLPSLSQVEAARRIAREVGAPLILENVRGAQPFIGKSAAHYGPFHLWGDVPALLPVFQGLRRKKGAFGSKQKAERAEIPVELAEHIGRCFASSPA